MFKLVAAVMLSLTFATASCAEKKAEVVEPTHSTVYYASSQRILNIYCGSTCILTADPTSGNFVATMVDGSTVTFKSIDDK